MTAAVSTTATGPIRTDIARRFAARRHRGAGAAGAPLRYVVFAFDVPGLAGRASTDNARILVSDAYCYKPHVTRDNRTGSLVVAIEGKRNHVHPPERLPPWVIATGTGRRSRCRRATP